MAFPRPGPPFEGYGMCSKSLTACVHIPWSMHSKCKGQDFSILWTQSLEKGPCRLDIPPRARMQSLSTSASWDWAWRVT